MARQTFLVTAHHPHPSFCFCRHPVRVSQDAFDHTFYADAATLGCGRNYRTANEAIKGLFEAHACTVTKIESAERNQFNI